MLGAEDLAALQAAVTDELAAEITRLVAQLHDGDMVAIRLQEQVYAAEDSGDPKADELHRKLMRNINTGTTLSHRVQVLRTPEEVQRRVSDQLRRYSERVRLDELAAAKAFGV
jgi:hypothetical protein